MDETWDDYANDWDENPDVIKYSELAYKSLIDFLDISNKKVLDFGCGTGLLTGKIAKNASSVLAIDTSSKMLEILKNKDIRNVTTLHRELSKEAVEEHTILQSEYDIILASSVCAFIPYFNEVLPLIKSLLKPNGVFIQWDWESTKENPDFGFDEETIKKLYKEAGLSLIKIDREFTIQTDKGSLNTLMAVGKKED